MNDPKPNNSISNLIWWAIPGVLAGMPIPYIHLERRMHGGGPLDAYDDELPLLHQAGIRAVVSLLNLPSDAAVYKSAGFDFLCLPVADGQPPTIEQVYRFVSFVAAHRPLHRAVAVHCEGGLGRTGTMLAAYLIAEGQSATDAIAQIRAAEPSAIETPQQIQFLREFTGGQT